MTSIGLTFFLLVLALCLRSQIPVAVALYRSLVVALASMVLVCVVKIVLARILYLRKG